MSGVEIAAFVLGGFPLLIAAAEHYKDGFEPLVKWKRFRTVFLDFIDAVDIEKQLFDQMLERFLISADVSQDDLQSFMTIPNYDGWRREDLASALQTRLGPSYNAFLGTVQTMQKLMAELHDLLLLKDGKIEWASDGASQWEYQLKRIRLSFSKKGPKTLASFEIHNRKLAELLDSKDKLDSIKATVIQKDTTWATIFGCIRRHASSLHTAITNGWNCECVSPHTAALQLQHRKTSEWTSHFSVAFNPPSEGDRPDVVVNSRREVVLSIKQEKEKKSPTIISQPPSTKDIYSNTSTLRRDLESKSSPDLNAMMRPTVRTSISSSSSSTLSSTGFSSLFKSSSNTSASSMSNEFTTSVTVEEKHLRNWLSSRSSKAKKSVRLNVPIEIPLRPNTFPVPNPMITETPPSPRDDSGPIKDLCSTLFCLHTETSCLGYIADDKEQFHELRPINGSQPVSRTGPPISLQLLLAGESGIRLSRQERYKIASILAASILQLQTTPWLTDKLDKGDVYFYHQDSKVLVEHPYINYSFKSKKAPHTTSEDLEPVAISPINRYADRESLSHLGILLLELCFGQSIESQEIRKSHLGSDGKPHSGTDYMTARDWTEMVFEEDPAFEHIIRCCVFCIFEEKPDWKSKSFTQAVYIRVVEPLESLINKWSSPT